jgi:hypothetical protein
MRRYAEGDNQLNPFVQAVGKVLRLVGISSPEDALPKVKSAADPPSWRDAARGTERDATASKKDGPSGS